MERKLVNSVWFFDDRKIIRTGLGFPFYSIAGILLTNITKEENAMEQNRDKILNYINQNKKVSISEIGKKFDLDIIETKGIINKLEKEGKILVNE